MYIFVSCHLVKISLLKDILYTPWNKSLQMVTAPMKLKDAYSLEEKYDQPR